ncbi:hypothetical protein Aperf_G00000004739 [Anoplocephala perfoliata]
MNLPFNIDKNIGENKEGSSAQEPTQATPSRSVSLLQEPKPNPNTTTDPGRSQLEPILQPKRAADRRNRRYFSLWKVSELERRFKIQRYISSKECSEIASALGLTHKQVRAWFQMRRHKEKNILSASKSNMPNPSEAGNNPSSAPSFDQNTPSPADSRSMKDMRITIYLCVPFVLTLNIDRGIF